MYNDTKVGGGMEEFSKRLQQALNDRDMKPATLSKLTGISKPLISNYLSGKYKAKQDNLYLLSRALMVDESWLMGFPAKTSNELDDIIAKKASCLSDEQKRKVIDMIDIIK